MTSVLRLPLANRHFHRPLHSPSYHAAINCLPSTFTSNLSTAIHSTIKTPNIHQKLQQTKKSGATKPPTPTQNERRLQRQRTRHGSRLHQEARVSSPNTISSLRHLKATLTRHRAEKFAQKKGQQATPQPGGQGQGTATQANQGGLSDQGTGQAK